MKNSQMYLFNSNAGISSTFLSSFLVPKKVCKSFTSRIFCNVALFSRSAIKLSTEPTSTNLSDIFKIKGWLASFRAKDDVARHTITFTSEKHRSSNQTPRTMIFYQWNFIVRVADWQRLKTDRFFQHCHASMWINLSTYEIKTDIVQRLSSSLLLSSGFLQTKMVINSNLEMLTKNKKENEE